MGGSLTFLFHTHLAVDYPQDIAALEERYPDHDFPVAHGLDELFEKIPDADVLVDHRVSEELLDRADRLKWLFIPFTGVNSIPMELLENRGIRISNNHGNAALVAERALSMALALMGRVAEFDRGMRRGHWFRNKGGENPFQFWSSLRNSNVLILGTGAIGLEIAELLRPFNCRVAGWRRRKDAGLPEGFDRMTDSLHSALAECDICFIALPLTDDTRELIGEPELSLLRGKRLINVARGAILDEGALYRSLEKGELAGAALDVWHRYPEPFHADLLPSEYPFHELDNVVLSPHAGSHTSEGKTGQLAGTIRNIVSLIENGEPEDIVEAGAGY